MGREQGFVSLWAGTAASAEALEEYLTIRYTEDGDAIWPPFAHEFGIQRFDEDFREADFIDPPERSLNELLAGTSYNHVTIPRFTKVIGATLPEEVNAIVLLYNFNYGGQIVNSENGAVVLSFRGVVLYE